MSCHRSYRSLLVLLLPAVLAAPARADKISGEIKSSTVPDNATVTAVIKREVADLTSRDLAKQKAARESLIYEAAGHAGTAASPQYQALYASDLAKALAPLVQAGQPLRVRLNAAVVAGAVGAEVNKTGGASNFAVLDTTLLNDKQLAIQLWGVKLARYVVAEMALGVSPGNPGALMKLVVKVTQAHPESGPLIEEAYGVLTLDSFRENSALKTGAAVVIPDLLTLIEWRAEQYQSGKDTPPSPFAEQKVTSFLPLDDVYAAVATNVKVRNAALKAMGEMTCAVLHSIANGNNAQDLVDMVRLDGAAVSVLGEKVPDDALRVAGLAVNKEIGSNANSDLLRSRCKNLADALSRMGVKIVNHFDEDAGPSDTTGVSQEALNGPTGK